MTTCTLHLALRGYSGTGMKCPNAAHLWQLGWAKPVADLDLSGLTVGRWRTFVLPVASSSLTNFLRLTGLTGGTYFINYRLAEGQYEQVCYGSTSIPLTLIPKPQVIPHNNLYLPRSFPPLTPAKSWSTCLTAAARRRYTPTSTRHSRPDRSFNGAGMTQHR